jgi:hypothetical protein
VVTKRSLVAALANEGQALDMALSSACSALVPLTLITLDAWDSSP